MPSKTLLLSAQGRPLLFSFGNRGSILAHWLSVSISLRIPIFSNKEEKNVQTKKQLPYELMKPVQSQLPVELSQIQPPRTEDD
jgi:hypothetical protein